MQFSNLEQNIVSVIEEQQAKLGFDGNAVYLFYPLSSLNALLGTGLDATAMQTTLEAFAVYCKERLGELVFSVRDDRFTLVIPPKGSLYVQSQMNENPFIMRFVQLISTHGTTIEAVCALFHAYSEHVHFERMLNNEEFDYLLYFEDGVPDAFIYCIKEEPMHMTYHRFTQKDYQSFGF